MLSGNVLSQYFVDCSSSSGHSTRSHSSGLLSFSFSSRWAALTGSRANRGVSWPAEPSRQVIVSHADSDRASARSLTLTGWCSASRRRWSRRPPATRPGLWRQRPLSGPPHRGVRLDAGRVGKAEFGDGGAQLRVGVVAGVHQHDPAWDARFQGSSDLEENDLRLRAEGDVVRHTGLAATIRVQGPVLGEIESVGDWQAGGMVGDRQGNSDLAIVLLAELTTVLTGDADQMPALFRKTSVVDDPGLDRAMTLDRWNPSGSGPRPNVRRNYPIMIFELPAYLMRREFVMRNETPSDVIATWFVMDPVEDASIFPQAGIDSSKRPFQETYWRCIVCFYVTAVRQAPDAKYVFYTNCDSLPTVEGLNIACLLEKLRVEVRLLPITHRLGKEKVNSWNNQFYILDIIKDLSLRSDYTTVVIMDSDCVWVRSPQSLLSDIDRRGILSLCIPYTEEFVNNGATRLDMQRAASQLTDRDIEFVPHYSGGEMFAAKREKVAEIWRYAEPMWKKLSSAPAGTIKVFEEGQFLSIIYELLDVPTGTADAHCRRMWTALRLNNVSAEDVYSSRCIWHLPMEKHTGFAKLARVISDPHSWIWVLPSAELSKHISQCMGIPSRTLTQLGRQFTSRVSFHFQGLRSVNFGLSRLARLVHKT